jgi:beta-alanine degradation protein BauB
MNQDPYGPIGSRTLITTDTMTVWEIRLAGGERLAMHHHRHPYVVVHVSDGHIRVTELEGQVIEREVTAGMADWHPVGEIHELTNLADRPYMNVLVELKAPISSTASQPS